MRYRLSQVTIQVTIFVLLWTFCAFPVQKAYMDQWFDIYECLPWEEEKLRLDNLAVYLSRNKKMIGYLAFYVGEDSKMDDFESRVESVRDHLVRVRGINSKRIIIVKMGKVEKTKTILQPVENDRPPPIFPK